MKNVLLNETIQATLVENSPQLYQGSRFDEWQYEAVLAISEVPLGLSVTISLAQEITSLTPTPSGWRSLPTPDDCHCHFSNTQGLTASRCWVR